MLSDDDSTSSTSESGNDTSEYIPSDSESDFVYVGTTAVRSRTDRVHTHHLERNAARMKDFTRVLPKPLVVVVQINGAPVRALLDSGSLADFVSTTLVDQLHLKTDILVKPLSVQLAVTGSRSKVNHSVSAQLQYQSIDETRRFDVINLDNYDVILGTPFLFQHKVLLGFNPSQIAIGSAPALPIQGDQATTLSSLAADLLEDHLEILRRELQDYARDICKEASETPLPPLRAVNHSIPLIDETKVYAWRPSRCPDALKPLWQEKCDAYIRNGRWQVRTGMNAMPMLMLKKPDQG
ncbi:hypothetical protein NEOLEDRAFT_1073350, partial [Neolentinus lepideus HHB14362 ss-1]